MCGGWGFNLVTLEYVSIRSETEAEAVIGFQTHFRLRA